MGIIILLFIVPQLHHVFCVSIWSYKTCALSVDAWVFVLLAPWILGHPQYFSIHFLSSIKITSWSKFKQRQVTYYSEACIHVRTDMDMLLLIFCLNEFYSDGWLIALHRRVCPWKRFFWMRGRIRVSVWILAWFALSSEWADSELHPYVCTIKGE